MGYLPDPRWAAQSACSSYCDLCAARHVDADCYADCWFSLAHCLPASNQRAFGNLDFLTILHVDSCHLPDFALPYSHLYPAPDQSFNINGHSDCHHYPDEYHYPDNYYYTYPNNFSHRNPNAD